MESTLSRRIGRMDFFPDFQVARLLSLFVLLRVLLSKGEILRDLDKDRKVSGPPNRRTLSPLSTINP